VLKMINRCYDLEIACQEAPSAEARRAACDERDRLLPRDKSAPGEELPKTGASPTRKVMFVFRTVVSIALPSLSRARVSFNEANALNRLGRSMLVLRAYREQNGGFPDRLESLSASDRHGVSVAPQQHGYRFTFHSGAAGGYAYTAVPEAPGTGGARSFCADGTGTLVTLGEGAEPEVRIPRCVDVSEPHRQKMPPR
jgi:hypothetical protein